MNVAVRLEKSGRDRYVVRRKVDGSFVGRITRNGGWWASPYDHSSWKGLRFNTCRDAVTYLTKSTWKRA